MITELKERLGAELDRIAGEVATARSGGRAHVDDDDGLRERERQLSRLGQLVAGLASVDPTMIWHDRAGYGSTVRLRIAETGEERTHMLMAGDFIDLDEGQVSLASPVGQALLGRRAGDRVTVAAPRGERVYEIVSLVTLPAELGIGGPDRPSGPAASQLQVA